MAALWLPRSARRVIHVDVTAFCVAVERVVEPRLRGRPVLVAPLTSPRAVVCDVSTEAWHAGVERGMPVARARRICRDVTVVAPHPELYRRATEAMERLLGRFSPLLEPAGAGHFFLDLAGTERLFGPAQDAAERIRRELGRELRLTPAVGLAANKLVGKVAARTAKPEGLATVREGDEAGFLAPLGVVLLPGLGSYALAQMEELNVTRICELAALTREQLALAFGRCGPGMWERARGIDPTPVLPHGEVEPSVRREAVLPEDTNDDDVLVAHLFRLVEQAVRELRARGRWARDLHVTVVHSDGMESSRGATLARATDIDFDLYPVAEALFVKAFQRRVRVRRLAVRLTHPAAPDPQLALFDAHVGAKPDSVRRELVAAVDRIRARFGWEAIGIARAAAAAAAAAAPADSIPAAARPTPAAAAPTNPRSLIPAGVRPHR